MKLLTIWHKTLVLEGCLLRHTRLLAVLVLLPIVMRWGIDAVLVANLCPSKVRLISELSDETIVMLGGGYSCLLKVSAVITGALLVIPVVPLLLGRVKTVFRLLLFVLVCVAIEPRHCLPWEIVFPIEDQIRTAYANIARQTKLAKLGIEESFRTPLHSFEQRNWKFADGRYEVWKTEGGKYFLLDKRGRSDLYDKDIWKERVLLEDVVRWNDCKDHLYVVTKDGKRYVLDYATHKLMPYGKEGVK